MAQMENQRIKSRKQPPIESGTRNDNTQKQPRYSVVSRELQKEREQRIKRLKEQQYEQRQKKMEHLKLQAMAEQKFREQNEEQRLQRMDDLRKRENERRLQVEERRRAIVAADKERREYILRKTREHDQRMEIKRRNERDSVKVQCPFGSSTPRMIDRSYVDDRSNKLSSSFCVPKRPSFITNAAATAQINNSSRSSLCTLGPSKAAGPQPGQMPKISLNTPRPLSWSMPVQRKPQRTSITVPVISGSGLKQNTPAPLKRCSGTWAIGATPSGSKPIFSSSSPINSSGTESSTRRSLLFRQTVEKCTASMIPRPKNTACRWQNVPQKSAERTAITLSSVDDEHATIWQHPQELSTAQLTNEENHRELLASTAAMSVALPVQPETVSQKTLAEVQLPTADSSERSEMDETLVKQQLQKPEDRDSATSEEKAQPSLAERYQPERRWIKVEEHGGRQRIECPKKEVRNKAEREEAKRKAREQAEHQRLELIKRLRIEEKEREERRKRVETIMSRTRTTESTDSTRMKNKENGTDNTMYKSKIDRSSFPFLVDHFDDTLHRPISPASLNGL
ncbi:ensconsin-like [Anopheles cruzii]|uniref:ensconsin-like n=1 Tax=Anopheles cruzii TaxID=68878 RepID=UPI0022EC29F9|nr:ensconsin-like [Anopheles cruzii]